MKMERTSKMTSKSWCEGKDLIGRDYEERPELDFYDETMLDQNEYDDITGADRRAAEAEIKARGKGKKSAIATKRRKETEAQMRRPQALDLLSEGIP